MYLYLVYNSVSNLTKIGITENIERRVLQLTNACGDQLDLVTYIKTGIAPELERLLHVMFSCRRTHGEWFRLTEDDIRLIQRITGTMFPLLSKDDNSDFPYGYEILIDRCTTNIGWVARAHHWNIDVYPWHHKERSA